MKTILTEETIAVPDKVEISVKSKKIQVTGPLGTLKRKFNNANMDIQTVQNKKNKKRSVVLQMWQENRKNRCCVNSVASQIRNMIRGVNTGYKFKMIFAHAHFPIMANVIDNGNGIEIHNFMGEKIVRVIKCLPGTTIHRTDDNKYQITVQGNDLNNVSLTCALIHQSVAIKNKDIRQFLDGIYCSEKRLDIKA